MMMSHIPMTGKENGRLVLSVSHHFAFWGALFLALQQFERLFLLPTTLTIEAPTISLLLTTLATGVLQDLQATGDELVFGSLLAALMALFSLVHPGHGHFGTPLHQRYQKCLMLSLLFIALVLVAILTVDVGYYRFGHQRLNFVFFEYLADLWSDAVSGTQGSQAAEQTSAELRGEQSREYQALVFLFLAVTMFVVWRGVYRRIVMPLVATWKASWSLTVLLMLGASLLIGATGSSGERSLLSSLVESDTYFTLSQNPLLFAKNPIRSALFHRWEWVSQFPRDAISEDDAIAFYESSRGQEASFPYHTYPLVTQRIGPLGAHLEIPLNVLLIFVEGLDRRYLNRTVQTDRPIRVTPFLDRLREQSVYFDNFFANGVQTSRGLFSTLCSYYPRHGAAAIKTRADRHYLCLPSVLRERGYKTEMVVGQPGTINNLRDFFSRNGIERLYDINDFPADAERMGLGVTDSAILTFIKERVKASQGTGRPLFLTSLTLSTHHPFLYPKSHPDVSALQYEQDQYLPALRYFDSEFERFFVGLQHDGLLKNTIVFVLGDHGRHESQGQSTLEQQIGHFMTPLFVWLDESLQTPQTFHPHVVEAIASQVDIAPTIAAITGSQLSMSPFVGEDLSCLLVRECLVA